MAPTTETKTPPKDSSSIIVDLLLRLPVQYGLMITLSPHCDSSTSNDDTNSSHHQRQYQQRQYLTLHPQIDANLPRFHPNIYIPQGMLNDAKSLVKYGGGGSGVTVFGGYHPSLRQQLVMKHGGYKDLLELVSLAKIDREIGLRAQFVIDTLASSNASSSSGGIISSTTIARSSSSLSDKTPPSSSSSSSSRRSLFQLRRTSFKLPSVRTIQRAVSDRIPTISLRKNSTTATTNATTTMSTSIDEGSTAEYISSSSTTTTANKEVRVREIQSAALNMTHRLPTFSMIYISPRHVRRDRYEELSSFVKSRRPPKQQQQQQHRQLDRTDTRGGSTDNLMVESTTTTEKSSSRAFHIFGSSDIKATSIHAQDHHIDLCFGGRFQLLGIGTDNNDDDQNCAHIIHESQPPIIYPCNDYNSSSSSNTITTTTTTTTTTTGYASLMAFVEKLRYMQEMHDWKITLGQKKIGRTDSRTASYYLTKGMLHGRLLQHLIDSEIRVIRNLQLLTMPEEMVVLDQVRSEYEHIIHCQQRQVSNSSDGGDGKIILAAAAAASDLSKVADDFVGKSIKKNYDPMHGRFVLLKQFGIDLESNSIHLKPTEIVPGRHLKQLFSPKFFGASWEELFHFNNDPNHDEDNDDDDDDEKGTHHQMIFDSTLQNWQSLLELSLSMKHPNATNRIWTCGITDGGLHNMFLSDKSRQSYDDDDGDDVGLWFFDLGTPSLEPIPAFLTKFLMSFFHVLGMEEDENGKWIVRFEQDDDLGKLRLTKQTESLIPQVMHAFNTTMDRLIEEFFPTKNDNGDQTESTSSIRVLLLRYVVTQLLSDAAFCIEKWRIKGGGDMMRSSHQYDLEKWLWRGNVIFV